MQVPNTYIKAEDVIAELDKIQDKLVAGVYDKAYSDIGNNIGEVVNVIYRCAGNEDLPRILNNYYQRNRPFAQRATIPEIKVILNIGKYKYKKISVSFMAPFYSQK